MELKFHIRFSFKLIRLIECALIFMAFDTFFIAFNDIQCLIVFLISLWIVNNFMFSILFLLFYSHVVILLIGLQTVQQAYLEQWFRNGATKFFFCSSILQTANCAKRKRLSPIQWSRSIKVTYEFLFRWVLLFRSCEIERKFRKKTAGKRVQLDNRRKPQNRLHFEIEVGELSISANSNSQAITSDIFTTQFFSFAFNRNMISFGFSFSWEAFSFKFEKAVAAAAVFHE